MSLQAQKPLGQSTPAKTAVATKTTTPGTCMFIEDCHIHLHIYLSFFYRIYVKIAHQYSCKSQIAWVLVIKLAKMRETRARPITKFSKRWFIYWFGARHCFLYVSVCLCVVLSRATGVRGPGHQCQGHVSSVSTHLLGWPCCWNGEGRPRGIQVGIYGNLLKCVCL